MNERALQKFVSQISTQFSSHENAINEMNKRVNEVKNQADSMHNFISSKQRIEEQIAIDSASFEKVNAYVNIIIFAGYAGFFAIWSFTNNQLPEKAKIWTALLVGMSLFFFITWEVLRASLQSSNVVKAFKLSLENHEPNEYQQLREALREKAKSRTKLLISLWKWFLLLTVVLGLAGGLLLAYNFVAILISPIPHWPT